MPETNKKSILDTLTLGKATEYQASYDPGLLQAVPRALGREQIGITADLPFVGEDVWHGYELSWLNLKGKPQIALLRCVVPCTSPNLIESKSFKLYLNSFNQSRFDGTQQIIATLSEDLSKTAEMPVEVTLFGAQELSSFTPQELPGQCIDGLDIEISDYTTNPLLLECIPEEGSKPSTEVLHSHLLKSNCLITNQPDWASVVIGYTGPQINHASLLKYLISFRMHNEFHEQCVERIFTDLRRHCGCHKLSVQALYTRRGGLDINPYRSTCGPQKAPILRTNRQ